MRSLLRSVLRCEPDFEVAGTAADGASALGALETLRPDLILLDVEMPVMDGLVTLRKLRRRGHTMPVIMCSSLTQRGARVTIEALASGASDYVAKPVGPVQPRQKLSAALAHELASQNSALDGQSATDHRLLPLAPRPFRCFRSCHPPRGISLISSIPSVLAIGVSTGGPAALDILLPALPPEFPLPVLIVQHMPELFTRLLAERSTALSSARARSLEGELVRPAPSPLRAATGTLKSCSPLSCRAASTCTSPRRRQRITAGLQSMCSFARLPRVYGSGVLAVVLTGMGSDGLAVPALIRAQGGTVLAQDQATSTVWGMPGAVAAPGWRTAFFPFRPSLRRSCVSSGPRPAPTHGHCARRWPAMTPSSTVDYGYLRQTGLSSLAKCARSFARLSL